MTKEEEIAAIEASVAEGVISKEEGESLIAQLGPRYLGAEDTRVQIAGFLLCGDDKGPLTIRMPGSEDIYIPVFSTRDKLGKFADDFNLEFTTVKQILDPVAFFDGMSLANYKIIADPYKHENGRCRFIQIWGFENAS